MWHLASSCGLACLLALAATAQDPAPANLRAALDAADATWHGATAIADGVRGGAAHFAGDATIDLGACPLTSRSPFTLRCHLRTVQPGFATALIARDGEDVGGCLTIGREPGVLAFEAWSWRTVKLCSQRRVDDGAWHKIEVSYDPATTTAILLVDGAVQAAGDLGAGGAPTAQLRLGDNVGVHQPFAGDLDELEIERVTTHRDELRAASPVLARTTRESELRALRERLLPTATPGLRDDAAAAWPQRRLAVRAHVADAIGLAPEPAREPLAVQVHDEVVRDGVKLQRLSWSGFPGLRATGWLWSPAAPAAGQHPAILCPHGHWANGAMHPVVQARCAAFAQFGWLALAVDSVHVEHVPSGVNAIGAMTWHNERALDLLLARDDVDASRIGVTGASGGGQQTYYLMALDDRIAAAAPMVMTCYFTQIVTDDDAHCGCNHPPRLAAGLDVPEMCAVFAPRPAMFGSVTGDWTHAFPQQGLPELTAHWSRLHGPAPRSRHANEGHNYDRPMREEVYAFFHDVLVGPAAGGAPRQRVDEPAFAPFPLGEMQQLARTCPPVQLDANTMAAQYLARRAKVADLAALAPGIDLKITPQAIAWLDDESATWRRGTVRDGDGVSVPLRARGLAGPGDEPIAVVVDPAGMTHAMRDAALPARAVVFDARPYGEWSPYRGPWQRNGLLLGRGEGYVAAHDAALVCASLPGSARVHLTGRGEAGVVAVLAAHLCPRIVSVHADDLGASYTEEPKRLPLCPELLRWRDVPELIATLPATCTFAKQ
jgi:hypothetical protein